MLRDELTRATETVGRVAALNFDVLVEKRNVEIAAYTAFYIAMAGHFSDRELAEAFSRYSGLRQLANGDIIIALYGTLLGDPDPKNKFHGFNGDGTWAGGTGEQLVIIVDKTGDVRYAHLVQARKLDELRQFYNPRYENLTNEPVNFNGRWLWPDDEYQDIEFRAEDPAVAGYIPTLGALPQTIKVRDLTPEDIAKHPIFAQEGLRTISRIAESLFEMRDATAGGYDESTARLEKIALALR